MPLNQTLLGVFVVQITVDWYRQNSKSKGEWEIRLDEAQHL